MRRNSNAPTQISLLPLPADDLPQSLKALVQQDDIAVADHTLHIGYDQMSADQVIRVRFKVAPGYAGICHGMVLLCWRVCMLQANK